MHVLYIKTMGQRQRLSYLLLGILIALIAALSSCKNVKKNSSSLETIEAKKETRDERREVFESEGRSAELIKNTTTREDEVTETRIQPKGEFIMTPDGQFIGEATSVETRTTKQTEKKIEEKTVHEDTATTNTISQIQEATESTDMEAMENEHIKKRPSLNWIILAVILVFLAVGVARWKGWL